MLYCSYFVILTTLTFSLCFLTAVDVQAVPFHCFVSTFLEITLIHNGFVFLKCQISTFDLTDWGKGTPSEAVTSTIGKIK